ncbi:MAG: hypothetical protein MJB14_22715 [Spirochaetes bacterium]|nr:hypothetical protein [Spirochaetota bacterium]
MNVFKRIHLFFLYHQHKYEQVLKKTPVQFISDIDKIDTPSLRYQAKSSFFQKNFYHARMCIELLIEKRAAKADECNLLAHIYARHNEKEKAISAWCTALEIQKKNRHASKALEYIRQQGREVNLYEDELFDKLIPGQPFFLPFSFFFKLIAMTIILGVLAYGIYWGYTKWQNQPQPISELTDMVLPDYNPNILASPREKNEKHSYTEKQIKTKFEKIKDYILEEKAVEAQILINQIKLSNASVDVKMRTEALENYINEPDYALFKNKYQYSEINQEKDLYNNVFIKWPGRVVNKKYYEDRLVFEFVVGNEDQGVIDAVIPVIFKKAFIVENNDRILLFGRIKTDNKNLSIEGRFLIKE